MTKWLTQRGVAVWNKWWTESEIEKQRRGRRGQNEANAAQIKLCLSAFTMGSCGYRIMIKAKKLAKRGVTQGIKWLMLIERESWGRHGKPLLKDHMFLKGHKAERHQIKWASMRDSAQLCGADEGRVSDGDRPLQQLAVTIPRLYSLTSFSAPPLLISHLTSPAGRGRLFIFP